MCIVLNSAAQEHNTAPASHVEQAAVLAMADFLRQPYTTISTQTQTAGEELILLSSIKKVNGKWRAKKRERFLGRIESSLFEFDSIDIQSVRDDILRYAQQKKWLLAYECQGLGCGRSHAWANEIFKRRRLTGIDATQSYHVWKDPQVEGSWHMTYLIERGDRRIYLYSRALRTTTEGSASQLADAEKNVQELLKSWQQGFAVLLGVNGYSAGEKQALEQWLAKQAIQRFWVVGHNHDSGLTVKQQRERALSNAKSYAEQLTKQWPEYKFEPYSVGPLAPRGNVHQTQHIEIIPAR